MTFRLHASEKHIHFTPDRPAFVEALRPHLERAKVSSDTEVVKRASQISLEIAKYVEEPLVTQTSPASKPPSLHTDMGSAAPTPNLTNEPNSPSSSSPSTADGAVDEPELDRSLKARATSVDGIGHGPEVRVEDA